jgi:hypothetical protein
VKGDERLCVACRVVERLGVGIAGQNGVGLAKEGIGTSVTFQTVSSSIW